MSFQALGWVVEQKPTRAVDKLLLYGLADRHNTEEGTAFPSVAWLTEFSGLDRKTVIAGLDRLETEDFISDTGERRGRTSQIKVYRLHLKNEGSQKRNSSVFPGKGSQKRDTEPRKEPGRIKKALPSSSKAVARKTDPYPRPEGVDPQAWTDFLTNRKRKRMANTATAHKRLTDDINRLALKGWTAAELIEHAAAKGWGGIYEPDSRNGTHSDGARGDGLDQIVNPMVRAGLRSIAAERTGGSEAGRSGRVPSDAGAGGRGGSADRDWSF